MVLFTSEVPHTGIIELELGAMSWLIALIDEIWLSSIATAWEQTRARGKISWSFVGSWCHPNIDHMTSYDLQYIIHYTLWLFNIAMV